MLPDRKKNVYSISILMAEKNLHIYINMPALRIHHFLSIFIRKADEKLNGPTSPLTRLRHNTIYLKPEDMFLHTRSSHGKKVASTNFIISNIKKASSTNYQIYINAYMLGNPADNSRITNHMRPILCSYPDRSH